MSDDSPLSFPCDLPIKVFGRNEPEFKSRVLSIVRSHRLDVGEDDVRQRRSRRGSYTSLTVTVHVESRAQADAVYRELTADDDVLMVL